MVKYNNGYPIKKNNILIKVIDALENEHLKPTMHALERMQERGILLSDVHEAIYCAKREEHKDEFNTRTGDWKYAIRGLNAEGSKDIRLIVVFVDPTTLILTVIDLE